MICTAVALIAKLDQGELAQVVENRTLDAFAKGKLLIGRQIVHLLCHQLKINADMSLVYSISDLAALRWLGDEPNKVLRFNSAL